MADGFKNSTKTHYMKGGACEGYAKGGKVKGAAKISKVMGEFKAGKLHSGSKSGPEVTSKKQATAIALSEARKAGAKIPVKRNEGTPMGRGPEGISTRPVDKKGRRMTMDEMNTPERILEKSGRADPYEKMPARDRNSNAEMVKLAVSRVPARERNTDAELTALQARLQRPVTKAEMEAARAARGKGSFRSIPLIGKAMDALGMKKGGLSAMPKGKGGKC